MDLTDYIFQVVFTDTDARVQNFSFSTSIRFVCGCVAALGLCCCEQAFSSCGRELLWLQCAGCSLHWVPSRRGAWALGCADFSSCSTWARWLGFLGSKAQAQQSWSTDSVAPRHVCSSWTKANWCPPALQGSLSTTGPPGNPPQ